MPLTISAIRLVHQHKYMTTVKNLASHAQPTAKLVNNLLMAGTSLLPRLGSPLTKSIESAIRLVLQPKPMITPNRPA